MAERKQARNIYFDCFAEAYLNHYGLPYNAITADFVGLDQITNKGPLAPRMTLEVFQRGVSNYFASELGAHTLKHLCSMFVPFWKAPQNRYKQPKTNGLRSVGETQSLAWPIRLLQRVNKLGRLHPERAEELGRFIDELEGMSESDAMQKLDALENQDEREI